MNAKLGIFVALLLGAMLAAPYFVLASASEDQRPGVNRHLGRGVWLLIDPETACEYLVKDSATPRLTADGKHMGCKQ